MKDKEFKKILKVVEPLMSNAQTNKMSDDEWVKYLEVVSALSLATLKDINGKKYLKGFVKGALSDEVMVVISRNKNKLVH